MLDVLLIRPEFDNPHSMIKFSNKQNSFFNIKNPFNQPLELYLPLGLCYLAANLKKNDFSVEIYDLMAVKKNINDLITKIMIEKPRLIGIPVTSFSLFNVNQFIKIIRKNSDSKIVLGGPHITHMPEFVELLGADYGIRGDGEHSIVKLMNYLSGKKINISDIPGLVYFKKKLITKETTYIGDLDKLPYPDFNVLGNTRYFSPIANGKYAMMVASRGCPFDCVYCGLPYKKRRNSRKLRCIIKEMKILVKQGYKYIDFRDEIFTFDMNRVYKLCRMIIKEKIKIKWGCETRIDFVDYTLLKIMKQAGCQDLKFGIESGSERIKKILGKGIKNEKIIKIFKEMHKLRLKSVAFFLFGHPTETIGDMGATVNFIKKLKPDYMDLMLAVPIPGSRLYKIGINEGKIKKNVWEDVMNGGEIPVYLPDGVKLSEIKYLQRKSCLEFLLNPRNIIKNVFNIRSFYDILIRFSMLNQLVNRTFKKG
jgi:radical SAM superfamily enzyme YgiQ (UPF0313 family)